MPMPMQIAFFGASLVSAYRNGAATYYRGILRALAARGHRIRFYEPITPDRLEYRDILDPSWAQVIPFPADGEGVEAAIEHAASADVLIKASHVGVYDELLDRVLPQTAAPHALSIYWDIDPAATLERLAAPHDRLREQLTWYDAVLFRAGRERVREAYARLGVSVCLPIHNAVDPMVHHSAGADYEHPAFLTFLGHRLPQLEDRVQKLFLDVAAFFPQRRFVLAGPDWNEITLPDQVHHIEYVYTGEHNALNCSTLTVLNVTSERSMRIGYCPSARLFEAAAAGACVITDVWDGLETFFQPDREILLAQETEDVVAIMKKLNPTRAFAVGQQARDRCMAEHTFGHRASELEALLEGADRRQPAMTTH